MVPNLRKQDWFTSLTRTLKILVFSLLGLSVPQVAQADDFFDFHSFNAQILQGWTHELGDDTRTVLSLQYANGFRWGDTYFFADITDLDGRYAELHLRLSLGKTTGKSFRFGPIKDVLIASTFELPQGVDRQLYGIGFDWNIPGFRFLKTNFYKRYNPSLEGSSEQVTIAWNAPITLGNQNFSFDGFADIASAEGTAAANEQTQIAFLWNPKRFNNKLGIGVEYIYWHNKFGNRGVTERVMQLQLRYTL